MNKKELIAAVAEKTGVQKKEVEAVVKCSIDEIVAAVAKKEPVRLLGFGTFVARDRAKRKVKNPANGKTINVPACVRPAFKAGTAFRMAVNVKPAKGGKKK